MEDLKNSSNYLLKTDSNYLTQHIITKYLNLGYNSLKPEELAFTLIIPSFSDEFYKKTGESWGQKYNIKTLNNLKTQNINLNFLNTNSFNKNLVEYFEACTKGDLEKLSIFYQKYSFSELAQVRDKSGKSPLHLAAKEGHLPILEFLLENGHSLEIRDRLFRTPLQIACLYGHAVFAEYILRNNPESLMSRDLRGRTAAHFASCSPTVDCLNLILLYNKKCLLEKDYFSRSCLHYAVLNSSLEQIEFLRLLIDNGVDLNGADEEGKTILHYMSSSGKIRPISFLVDRGMDFGIKDKSGKTAVEIAINNQTRESIIVFSTPRHFLGLEDKKVLKVGVIGKKISQDKENLHQNIKLRKGREILNYENNGVVPNFLQNDFYEIMKQLQKSGVENFQHIRKPYLFSGSWFEGISNLEGLFEKIKSITPAESMIRTFNMLCPFEGTLPTKDKEKFFADSFYGYCYDFEKMSKNKASDDFFKACNCEEKKKGTARIIFENMIKKKELEIIALKEQVICLKEEISSSKNTEQAERKSELEKRNWDNLLKAKDEEISVMKKNLEIMKYTTETLKSNLERCESEKVVQSRKIKHLQKTIEVLNDSIQELNKDIQGYKNGEKIVKSTKAIIKSSIETKRNFHLKSLDFEQENAFFVLMKAIKKQNLNLKNELTKFDHDSDGQLTRYEFTNFLQGYLKTTRVYNLIDFFDLNKKYNDVKIEDIIEVVSKRNLIREQKEKELFLILLQGMKKLNLDVENFESKFDFSHYDKDASLELSLEEFKGFLEDLQILQKISDEDIRRLFNYIDEDDSGTITLEEFKTKLKTIEFLAELQNGEIKRKLKKEEMTISETKKFTLKGEKEDLKNAVISGEIKIQCLNLKANQNAGIGITSLKLRLTGISKKWIGKTINPEQISSFKYACRLPLNSVRLDNLGEGIIFMISNDEGFKSQLEIEWKYIIDSPNEWAINEERFFDDGSSFIVQIKFLSCLNQMTKPEKRTLDKQLKKSFLTKSKFEGFLYFEVVDISDLSDHLSKCGLSLQALFFDNTKEKFEGVLENGKLAVNKQIKKKVCFNEKTTVNYIAVRLYMASGSPQKDELIGETFIDFEEALNIQGEEMSSRFFSLRSGSEQLGTKVQIKIQFSCFKEDAIKEVKGTLKVKVHRARNLFPEQKSFFSRKARSIDSYFKLSLDLKEDLQLMHKTKTAKDNSNPNFEEDLTFQVQIPDSKDFLGKRQNLPSLRIELFDQNLLKDELIGSCEVGWQDCFEQPGEWKVNGFFELKSARQLICGEIYLSLNFIPENFLDRNLVCPDVEPLPGRDLSLPRIEGSFVLRILFLIDLKLISENGILMKDAELRPYFQITMPSGKEMTSAVFNKSEKHADNDVYIANQLFEAALDCENIGQIEGLKILVKNKMPVFSSDKTISSLALPIIECINFPGEWMLNNAFYLPHDPENLRRLALSDIGRIYLQARYVPRKMIEDNSFPQVSPHFSDLVKEEKVFKGKLYIYLVHCKDLPVADVLSRNSDPFVNFTFFNREKRISRKSSTMKNTLNPVFNELIEIDVSVADSELEKVNLRVEVFDEDPLRNDLLGILELKELQEIFYQPNSWTLNRIFGLHSINAEKEASKCPPQIYFQVNFLEEGSQCLAHRPILLEDLNKTLERFKKKGFLVVDVRHCKGLPKIEKSRNSIDPFVKVILYNGNEEISFKTKTIENTHYPLFDERIEKALEIADFRKCDRIRIEVWDSNSFSADELVGVRELTGFGPGLFEDKMNELALDDVFYFESPPKLTCASKFSNFGSVYLKLGFFELPPETRETYCSPEKEDYTAISKLSDLRGTLVLLLSHGKGLLGKDETGIFKKKRNDDKVSDPYVIIKFNNRKDLKSKVVKKTVNPIWSEKFLVQDFAFDFYNPGKLDLQIYDKDSFLNSDDLMGLLEVDLARLATKLNSWEINQYFKVEGKSQDCVKFEHFGELYLQAGFFEAEVAPRPEVAEDLERLERTTHVTFSCKIKIEHVLNIPMKTAESCRTGHYLRVTFPNKSTQQSKVIKKSYHPCFEESLKEKMSLNPNSLEPLAIALFEKTSLLSKDVLIGTAMCDSEALFKGINSWDANGYFEFRDETGAILNTQVYLKAGFFEDSCEELFEPLTDNPRLSSTMIKGQVFLNILNLFALDAKDAKSSDPFCEIVFGDEKCKTETRKNCLESEVQQRFLFDVERDYPSLIPKLLVNVWDEDLIRNDLIGCLQLDLVCLYQNKNKWMLNGIFDLQNGAKCAGKIFLQAKFIGDERRVRRLEEIEDFPETNENLREFLALRRKGRVVVAVIHAKSLIPEDGKTCDPFVQLTLNNTTKKTTHLSKNVNPVFKQKLEFLVDLKNIDELKDLELSVFDHDLIRNDLIGTSKIDIRNILLEKNVWAFNQIIELEGPKALLNKYNHFGSVYLQAKFIEDGSGEGPREKFGSDPSDQDFAPFLETMANVIESSYISGRFLIKLIHCRNLLKADIQGKADPYVVFELNKRKAKSKVVQNNLFPEFNQILLFDLHSQNKADCQFLTVTVFDEDVMSSEEIGTTKIDLNPLINEQSEVLNKIFALQFIDEKWAKKFPRKKDAGVIYLQLRFFKNYNPTTEENLEQYFNYNKIDFIEKQFVNGKLKVELINARDLVNRDGNNDASDPYALISIPNSKLKSFQSKTFKDNLNPDFNEIFEFEIANLERDKLEVVKIELKDKDFGFDESLGFVDIPLEEVFESKGECVLSGDFQLQGDDIKEKLRVRTLGTVNLKLTLI